MAHQSRPTENTSSGPPPERLHWIQVKLAFGNEGKVQARPAALLEVDGAHVDIHYLGGPDETVEVVEPDRLAELLTRDDVCRLNDEPLLLVNTYYRVFGLATGPATAPAQLKASLAFAFGNSSVTMTLPAGEDQPTLHTLALVLSKDRTDKDVAR